MKESQVGRAKHAGLLVFVLIQEHTDETVSGAFDVVCQRPPAHAVYLFLPDRWFQVSSASTR